MKNEPMLSVAQVCEMQPGTEQDPTWVNPGLVGYVEKIVATKTKKTGQPMNICTLRDQTGSANISLTVFGAVKFSEGDVIEVRGPGLRRTEFNGLAQVSMSKNSTVHIVGKSVHHEEQEQRKEAMEPAVNGTKQHVNGQTVGMAMKESIVLVRASHPEMVATPHDPAFWAEVHKTASAIIRLSNALEHGNLTPALSSKALPVAKEAPVSGGGRADPPKGPKPQPGPEGSVAFDKDEDSIPF